jgi:hypothetical protein
MAEVFLMTMDPEERRKLRQKVARRNRRRGKGNQTKMAKMLGVMNTGTIMGADGLGPTFACEFKSRDRSEAHKFMQQSVRNCPPGRIPLVMAHLNGDRRDNDLIMFRYQDWQKICAAEHYCAPRPTQHKEVKIKRRKK